MDENKRPRGRPRIHELADDEHYRRIDYEKNGKIYQRNIKIPTYRKCVQLRREIDEIIREKNYDELKEILRTLKSE